MSTKIRIPDWKLSTIYEGVMRHRCPYEGHHNVPCTECKVSFLFDDQMRTANYADIVQARDSEKRRKAS